MYMYIDLFAIEVWKNFKEMQIIDSSIGTTVDPYRSVGYCQARYIDFQLLPKLIEKSLKMQLLGHGKWSRLVIFRPTLQWAQVLKVHLGIILT